MKKNVGVLFGGRSGEHDVSLCSAASVVRALDREKYNVIPIGIDRDGKWFPHEQPVFESDDAFGEKLVIQKNGRWFLNHFEEKNLLQLHSPDLKKDINIDVVFPAIHGTFCEDGTLQGLLELAMVPFVGADLTGSAIGMDKDVSKRLLRDMGIPVVPWRVYKKNIFEKLNSSELDEIVKELELPLFIKPAKTGSSVGIKKVKKKEDLLSAIKYAFLYDDKILIEKSIDAREIEVAVLGNDFPEASVPGEIVPKHEFYSYEAKYLDSDGAGLLIPADLDEKNISYMKNLATEVYSALCCIGMARVDFFIDKRDNSFYFNEINTLPGFTSISMYPKLWEASGLPYDKLLDRLIEFAIERFNDKKNIVTEW